MRISSTEPTRAGVLAVFAGAATVGVGRFFGVLELYVLGAAAIAIVPVAFLWVALNRLSPRVVRHVRPDRVHAGAPAQVALEVGARHRLPELLLHEPVEHTAGATIGIAPLRRGEQIRASYKLPTGRRGPLSVGPLRATTTDPFGLAVRRRIVAPRTEILVYPRIDQLLPPRIGGAGPLGTHLARRALATSAGAEFHSQRTYVSGDDLRRVNWRASARSTDLVVRETTHDGRLLVHIVLDLASATDPSGDSEAFERAVSAAASVAVCAADRELPLRFELTDGTWFRGGPELTPAILERLALLKPDVHEVPAGGRTDHDLLGVAVLVSADSGRRSAILRSRVAAATAATVVVGVGEAGAVSGPGWFFVDAADPASFVQQWNALVGEHRAARAS